MGPEGVTKIQERRQNGRCRHPRRRHEHGISDHDQHVQRREGRLRLAGEMNDRGDQTQVDQRLDQEKCIPGLPVQQEYRARPVSGEHQGEHHRHADNEGFLGTLGPDQPGPEQNARSQHQPAYEEPGEERSLVGKGVLPRPAPVRHRLNRSSARRSVGFHRTSLWAIGCGLGWKLVAIRDGLCWVRSTYTRQPTAHSSQPIASKGASRR